MSQDYLSGSIQVPLPTPEPGPEKLPEPTSVAYARRGHELDIVRGGSRSQVRLALDAMEKKGEISMEVATSSDDATLTPAEELEEQDSEIVLADEDELFSDDTNNGYQTIVSADGKWTDENDTAFESTENFTIRIREINANNWSSSIMKDPRIGVDSRYPLVNDKLNELFFRYNILEQIGKWLVENRKAFLHSCDIWDLAEKAYEEAEKNIVPVLQKDFIKYAALECSESSFSRFIKNTVLSWEDGSWMSVAKLFSKEAKCAWVARAFHEVCLRASIPMAFAVKVLAKTSASKNKQDSRSSNRLNAGIETVAEYLVECADVKGSDVVKYFGTKIVEF